MANLNKVILIGNLTRDPEARRTNSGTSICKLGLAVNRRFKSANGEQREETTFVDIDVWGRQADFCRDYLRKGNPVYVEGRLKLDQWEDRTTQQKRSRLCVVAESVQSLSSRGGGEGGYDDQQSGYDGQQQATQSNQQQNWNAAPQGQPSAPPPPPFPAQGQQGQPAPAPAQQGQQGQSVPAPAQQNDAPAPDAFDVSDESIDDIPF